MIGWYDWAGGREAMLRFGPADGPVVVAAMPLLEEWNRTRAFVVTLLRALADRSIASMLPDLPGHGESLAPLLDLRDARAAFAAAAALHERSVFTLSVRGGALLDDQASPVARWQLSPATGSELVQDLRRVHLARGTGPALPASLVASLAGAEPASGARVVRLASDPRPADRHFDGPPLWRRAEPGNDAALAAVLADDIAAWIGRCVA